MMRLLASGSLGGHKRGARASAALPAAGRAGSGGRQGSTTLEFAILSVPFLMLLLFLMELGFDFYLQLAMDYAVSEGARNVQTGAAQAAPTAASFLQNYMCPAVSNMLNCSQISVNVQTITSNYYAQPVNTVPINSSTHKVDTSQFSFCPGQADDLMLVNAIYQSPTIIGLLLPIAPIAYPGPNGGMVRITSSSVAFINEPFTATDLAGC